MPLINCKTLHLAFGDVALLDHVDFSVDSRERIALIGRNGAGKSSLLRILIGESTPDDGEVVREKGVRVASVEQEPTFADAATVGSAVESGLAAEDPHEDESWRHAGRVTEVISRLGLDAEATIDSLSGGMKKRVALARALVCEPALLLLDEPTNHLDFDGIAWLEETLKAFDGAVIAVSHDRRFLESFATRIVELDRGQLFSYPGSFAEYQRRKAEMMNSESLANARFDKLLKEEEVWIRKGVEARRTRNEGRVRRLEELRRIRMARRDVQGKVNLTLDAGERSGKIVAELIGVSKSYGSHVIIRDFSAILQRGDRIGLIGPNGAGKTTLIKLMLGDLKPDRGTIKRGTQLQVAYFDQFREALDDEASLSDVISPGSEFIDIGTGDKTTRKHVISYLGDFLFPPQRARAKVKSLSGGERNRLLLARLFAKPANVLVLDEPTNDLDIETLELLESMLLEYAGTVILVSHDRTFLDNVVTQVFAFEGGGKIQEYVGGYAEWLTQRGTGVLSQNAVKNTVNAGFSVSGQANRKVKMSFNETRELESLPVKIQSLEKEQGLLQAKLAEGSIYVNAPADAKAVALRLDAIAIEIDAAMARWEMLELKRA